MPIFDTIIIKYPSHRYDLLEFRGNDPTLISISPVCRRMSRPQSKSRRFWLGAPFCSLWVKQRPVNVGLDRSTSNVTRQNLQPFKIFITPWSHPTIDHNHPRPPPRLREAPPTATCFSESSTVHSQLLPLLTAWRQLTSLHGQCLPTLVRISPVRGAQGATRRERSHLQHPNTPQDLVLPARPTRANCTWASFLNRRRTT